MNEPVSLAMAVAEAAEHIRDANHQTMARPSLPATEAYDVTGHVIELFRRHGQLLHFLAGQVHNAESAGYFDDEGLDPIESLRLAHGHLEDANTYLGMAYGHLASAHNNLGHLGQITPEED